MVIPFDRLAPSAAELLRRYSPKTVPLVGGSGCGSEGREIARADPATLLPGTRNAPAALSG
ncbi:MAG: hypothetical protein M3Y72_22745, partial [Acidobacteriota bacterium]|nr:hypothetical protein [Acidobacteriota bacterium]